MTYSPDNFRSAIYAGQVMHRRLHPRRHRFVYRIRSFLFDVDELDGLAKSCSWFSLNRFNLFSFYYRDIGAGRDESPRRYLEDLLQSQGLHKPLARASLLCYPRILGYAFNPLSVYFCHDRDDALFALVYEVNNTFGERHSYLIPVDAAQQHAPVIHQHSDKQFYVSPFMSMDQRYHFRVCPPGSQVAVGIRQSEAGTPMLTALFRGERRVFSDGELLKTFFALPLMTVKVTAAIHWEALKLWLKGLRLQARPRAPRLGISVQPPRR